MFRAIDGDEWMYICVWDEARTGKSTCCQGLLYNIYESWETVLQANIFNLNMLLYNLKHGIPVLWPTLNKLHMRIPGLNWDDFAAHSGKAKTQHDKSWDVFKGAFDTLGTKLSVLFVNMVDPESPTQQLQAKYTHEIWIYEKGCYKYDRLKRRQDYKRPGSKLHKDWLEEGTFDQMPKEYFLQYDQMRMALADEVLQIVEDSIVETHMSQLLKRVQSFDLTLLRLIQSKGVLRIREIKKELGVPARLAVTRCKARGLIIPVRLGPNYYKYDLTDLGLELLRERARLDKQKEIPELIIPATV